MAALTLSVAEAAKELGVSRPTMYQIINRKDFPSFRVGGRVLISRELLGEWVKDQSKKGESA